MMAALGLILLVLMFPGSAAMCKKLTWQQARIIGRIHLLVSKTSSVVPITTNFGALMVKTVSGVAAEMICLMAAAETTRFTAKLAMTL